MTYSNPHLDARQLKTEAWLFSLNAWRHAEENNLIQIIEVDNVCQDKINIVPIDTDTNPQNP